MALWISRFLVRVPDCKDIDRLQMIRQRRSVKVRPFPNLRKSLTAPDGNQADGLEIDRCRRFPAVLQH
jgi:hypothetical protein